MENYKILTLGASGAGKTVFLASMFKALSTQGEDGFYLEVEDQMPRKLLNSIYTQIITGDIWPKGTRYSEVSEWTFTCRVKQPDNLEHYPACQFTYFDYAGGRLTDADKDAEFEGMVKQADAVLVLLDGQKIYSFIKNNNEQAVDIFLKKDLPSILKWIENCRVPIHFVISKWDLIQDEFSLKQVRDRLLTIPDFEQFIQTRNQAGSPLRLIPVSSVGSGFATLQPDGSMKKNPGAVPQPFKVEVPVACVLPDGLKAQLTELVKQQKNFENKNISNLNIWWGSLAFAAQFFEMILPLLPDSFREIDKASVQKLLKFITSGTQTGNNFSKELLKKQEESLKLVKDEQTALNHAIDSFLYVQQKLALEFPESELTML